MYFVSSGEHYFRKMYIAFKKQKQYILVDRILTLWEKQSSKLENWRILHEFQWKRLREKYA